MEIMKKEKLYEELNKLLEDRLSTYNSIEGRDPFAILHKLAGYKFITEGCDNNDNR